MIRWCLGAAVLALTVRAEEVTMLSGRAMGTTWTVKFVQPAVALERDDVARRVAARLEALEQVFSTFRPGSEISRFNAAPGSECIPVSAEFARVAADSRALSELTQGAFDPTVLPLVRLWGFAGEGRSGGMVPTDDEIRAARRLVGWRNFDVRTESPTVWKSQAGVALDLSSMAKGFASDEIVRLLGERGARDCFVQIAGDISCSGHAADGKPWRVGIEEPREEARAIAAVVALSDRAVSTSGNYRNFFRAGSRRYGHIIDPRTGSPVANGLAAVSVVDRTSARSSALATGLFVLGPEDGWRLAKREGLACLFFVARDDGTLFRQMTPEFERLLAETQLSSAARR